MAIAWRGIHYFYLVPVHHEVLGAVSDLLHLDTVYFLHHFFHLFQLGEFQELDGLPAEETHLSLVVLLFQKSEQNLLLRVSFQNVLSHLSQDSDFPLGHHQEVEAGTEAGEYLNQLLVGQVHFIDAFPLEGLESEDSAFCNHEDDILLHAENHFLKVEESLVQGGLLRQRLDFEVVGE